MRARFTIPYRTWSQAIDKGTMPEMRAWLRECERAINPIDRRAVNDLAVFGYTQLT